LLAGSALASGVAALTLMANVEASLAACAVTASPNTVDCSGTFSTTPTSNLNASTSPSTDSIQAFTAGGDVGVGASGSTVQADANITGAGLSIFNFQAGSNVTVVNSGSVTNNDPSSLTGGISIGANGGTVSYSGNGSAVYSVANPNTGHAGLEIINSGSSSIGSSTAPVTGATFSGNNAIYVGSGSYFLLPDPPGPNITTGPVNGDISIFLQGGTLTANGTPSDTNGIGIFANTGGGSGNVLIQTTGNTVINATSIGINVQGGGSGTVTINTDANITGTARFGIRTDAVDGATNITTSGSVFGGLAGISAVSIGAGPITINNTGTVRGGNAGISIFSDHAPVVINTTGNIAGINSNGIGVDSLTGSITIHATSGTVSGSAAGIFVGTGGSGNITIDGAATITGFSGILAGFDTGPAVRRR